MPTSPTQRTLTRLRREGYFAQVVERFNAHAKVRQDLFGFVDVVAVHPSAGRVLLVQATSHPNVSARVRKIVGERAAEARACLDYGLVVEVWGWRKVGRRWTATVRQIARGDLDGAGPVRAKRARKKAAKKVMQRELCF